MFIFVGYINFEIPWSFRNKRTVVTMKIVNRTLDRTWYTSTKQFNSQMHSLLNISFTPELYNQRSQFLQFHNIKNVFPKFIISTVIFYYHTALY